MGLGLSPWPGAAVPAAEVTLADTETQMSRATLTNEAGRYIFVNVPSGTYTVKISKAGFSLSETANVKVTVGNTITINSDDMAGNTTGYQTNFTGLGGTQTGGASSGVIPTPVESVEEVRVQDSTRTRAPPMRSRLRNIAASLRFMACPFPARLSLLHKVTASSPPPPATTALTLSPISPMAHGPSRWK